jgi:hypothetical protein
MFGQNRPVTPSQPPPNPMMKTWDALGTVSSSDLGEVPKAEGVGEGLGVRAIP